MSKIKYEIFGTDAEVVSFEQNGDGTLLISLPDEYNGFISVNGALAQLTNGTARYDLRYIEDGEHTPHLVLRHGRIALPKIKKLGRVITLAECDSEYIRSSSIRERRLAARVKVLEEEINQLKKCIYGTKIL